MRAEHRRGRHHRDCHAEHRALSQCYHEAHEALYQCCHEAHETLLEGKVAEHCRDASPPASFSRSKHRVDMTWSGHHHSYQRTCPIRKGRCVKDGHGVVHVVMGHAGAGLCTNVLPDTPKLFEKVCDAPSLLPLHVRVPQQPSLLTTVNHSRCHRFHAHSCGPVWSMPIAAYRRSPLPYLRRRDSGHNMHAQ